MSDFRQIASSTDSERSDRLFRASVSAFCSLSRPSKREITQLDDLTTPLLSMVSAASKRYVAAALSDCRHVPPLLVHLLAEEPVEICAPLLVRSTAFSDVDLIALIGRHGLPHARAIARRNELNPTIANLIRALEAQAKPVAASREETRVDTVRGKLRAIMEYQESRKSDGQPMGCFSRLESAALTGVRDLFASALADELAIPPAQLAPNLQNGERRDLALILKALDLNEEQAFLIVSALQPARFSHAEPIRLFIEAYRAIAPEQAADHLRNLKTNALAAGAKRHLRPVR